MNFHGGDIYSINDKNLIDFSSNINPLGVPESFKNAMISRFDEFTRYPDIKYRSLRQNLSRYLKYNHADSIVVGNGAVELIYKSIKAIECDEVISFAPTFAEYKEAALLCGKRYRAIPTNERENFRINIKSVIDSKISRCVMILCNPNNPTGNLLSLDELCELAQYLSYNQSVLIVDEAFIEFTDEYPQNSMVERIDDFSNVIIIRAATKFFGMPGIRLGYAVSSNKKLIDNIAKSLEPWNINTCAVIAADTVFFDYEYIEKSKKWISEEREFLFKSLHNLDKIKVYKSNTNYHLIKLEDDSIDAWELKRRMLQSSILIRTPEGFDNLTSYNVRLAVKDRESNIKLIEVLTKSLYI